MPVDDLSLRDLRAVAAVAALGHFGRAAAALGVPQPTLSARVQKAERELGATLFERTGRRFLITADGERLLPLVRDVVGAAERLRGAGGTEAWDARGGAALSLRLGVIPTLGPYYLPHLLLPLRRECGRGGGGAGVPALTISERPTRALIDALLDGTLEAALLSLPVRHDALRTIALFDEPFRLIAPKGSEILACDRLAPGRMSAADMVLLEEGHCLRDQALALCGKGRRRGGAGAPAAKVLTTSLETLKYLVAAGEGYSLLPQLASELPPALGALAEVRDFDVPGVAAGGPSRRVALCTRRTLPDPTRAAAERLAAFIRGHLPPGVRGIGLSERPSGRPRA